jgi:hypothetical protein
MPESITEHQLLRSLMSLERIAIVNPGSQEYNSYSGKPAREIKLFQQM